MLDPLSGKRILLMAPKFFGYEVEIACALAARGAFVDLLPDRPFVSPFMTATTRFVPSLVIPAATTYYRKCMSGFGRSDYDIIFIVNGQTLSVSLLSELRAEYARSKFILYLWDSIENRPAIIKKFRYFDEISTFDPKASKKYDLSLRHLFFGAGFTPDANVTYEYHLSFIGTAHTDRYRVVNQIDSALPKNFGRFWYLFLQARWVYHAYRITNPDFRQTGITTFQFEPMPRQKVQEVFRKSRAILDIEHPLQSGLTIRTLETFGAGKKLVTTNASIMDTEIYDPRNIYVIDRSKPHVPITFLESPYFAPNPEIYERYSLNGWLDEILLAGVGARSGRTD